MSRALASLLLLFLAGFLAAKSADTIAEGLRISPYRVTAPGETFIRYESAKGELVRANQGTRGAK